MVNEVTKWIKLGDYKWITSSRRIFTLWGHKAARLVLKGEYFIDQLRMGKTKETCYSAERT